MKPRTKTIPTILGLIVLVVGVGVGVIATQYETIFKLGAQSQANPQDVRISNISDTSVTVSWVTDVPTTASVLWGENQSLGRSTSENSTEISNTHFITLSELNPNTSYFFKINSAGKEFDNIGTLWQFKTTDSALAPQEPLVISGSVLNKEGQPAARVLVYITANGITPIAAITSESGNWLVPLDLDISQVDGQLLLQIFAQGGAIGVATAQIPAGAANPVPAITLGETHDFTDAQNLNPSQLPEASIEIPEVDTPDFNRFDFLDNEEVTNQENTSVTLESIENGEIVTTTTPEFFGEGPAGTVITITVESDPITDEVNVPQNGVWKWSPPTNLPPGEHKVTIKWLDVDGILRTLTRFFVVSAQEGPAFESTPSGNTPTPAPSVTPRSTPTLTPKPTVTPIATATATPRVSHPSTDSGTPNAGSLTPTLALSMISIGLFVVAFLISKKYA